VFSQINVELKDQLEQRIPERYYEETAIRVAVNKVQQHFKCCGLYNSTDWGKPVTSTSKSILFYRISVKSRLRERANFCRAGTEVFVIRKQ